MREERTDEEHGRDELAGGRGVYVGHFVLRNVAFDGNGEASFLFGAGDAAAHTAEGVDERGEGALFKALVAVEGPLTGGDGEECEQETCDSASIVAVEVVGGAASQLAEEGLEEDGVVGSRKVAKSEGVACNVVENEPPIAEAFGSGQFDVKVVGLHGLDFDAVFFDFAVEGTFGDVKFFGCECAFAAMAFEGEANGAFFAFFKSKGFILDHLGFLEFFFGLVDSLVGRDNVEGIVVGGDSGIDDGEGVGRD